MKKLVNIRNIILTIVLIVILSFSVYRFHALDRTALFIQNVLGYQKELSVGGIKIIRSEKWLMKIYKKDHAQAPRLYGLFPLPDSDKENDYIRKSLQYALFIVPEFPDGTVYFALLDADSRNLLDNKIGELKTNNQANLSEEEMFGANALVVHIDSNDKYYVYFQKQGMISLVKDVAVLDAFEAASP